MKVNFSELNPHVQAVLKAFCDMDEDILGWSVSDPNGELGTAADLFFVEAGAEVGEFVRIFNKLYYCRECDGVSYMNETGCANPDCPNQPCCGRPRKECDCFTKSK